MTIGELAKKPGLDCGMLRRLMDRGVLPCKRPPGGHRRVPDSAIPDVLKKLEEYGLIEERAIKKKKKFD
jgi:hypothetical protein